ncbi:MAG: sugar transferase, partial [Hungatella sp.]
MYTEKKYFEESMVIVNDIIYMSLSMLLAHVCRYGVRLFEYNMDFVMLLTLLLYLLIRALFPAAKPLDKRGYYEELIEVSKIQILVFVGTVTLLYLIHRGNDISRLMLGYFCGIDLFLMYTGRILLKNYLFRHYRYSNRSKQMLVITDSEQMEQLICSLKANRSWDFRTVGMILADQNMTGTTVLEIPIVADLDSLIEYVRIHPVDEVFIRVDQKFPIKIKKIIRELSSMGIIIDLNIQAFDLDVLAEKTLNQIGEYRVVTFGRKILSYQDQAWKRAMDLAGSLVGMLILGVACIFVAPLIKLESPGPVFFSQKRVGRNGRYFKLYKFRSMYRDAEARKQELMQYNEMQGLLFKMRDDPRVTKIGSFLRKTSIDELPQFLNVLKGDMSLVGTRPP